MIVRTSAPSFSVIFGNVMFYYSKDNSLDDGWEEIDRSDGGEESRIGRESAWPDCMHRAGL